MKAEVIVELAAALADNMKFGVFRNISGNIEALSDADRQFDEIGVDTKICLGEIVGMYPYVDDCVNFLIERGYVVLRTHVDDGFVGYCDGTFDFRGWSTSYLVEALKFARRNVTEMAVTFLRELPQRQVINGIAFEGLANVRGGTCIVRKTSSPRLLPGNSTPLCTQPISTLMCGAKT